jgi:hypothetical protein
MLQLVEIEVFQGVFGESSIDFAFGQSCSFKDFGQGCLVFDLPVLIEFEFSSVVAFLDLLAVSDVELEGTVFKHIFLIVFI